MSDLNYAELFELIIDELLLRAEEDITAFNYSYHEEKQEVKDLFTFFADKKKSRSREIVWKSPLHNEEEMTVSMDLAEGSMYVEMPGEDEGIEEFIGHGATNGNLKKKFMRLYRLVEFYVSVQLEEENMSNFFDSVQKTFPSIMDKFLLEKDDDEEENKEGGED